MYWLCERLNLSLSSLTSIAVKVRSRPDCKLLMISRFLSIVSVAFADSVRFKTKDSLLLVALTGVALINADCNCDWLLINKNLIRFSFSIEDMVVENTWVSVFSVNSWPTLIPAATAREMPINTIQCFILLNRNTIVLHHYIKKTKYILLSSYA